jgi:cation transport regulator ChaC
MKNYIFSYGSLINKDSFAVTIGKNNAGKAKPATIKGYERGWRNHVHPDIGLDLE